MTDRTTRAKRALELLETVAPAPWHIDPADEDCVVSGDDPGNPRETHHVCECGPDAWDHPAFIAASRTLLPQLARDVLELEAECNVLRQQRDYDYREALDGFAGLNAEIEWLESVIAAGREMYERACAERDAEREACERWVQRAANRGRLLERLERRLRDLEDRTAKVK